MESSQERWCPLSSRVPSLATVLLRLKAPGGPTPLFHRRLGVLRRLRVGTPDLPGLPVFSPPGASQVCAVPGRTILRPEPDGERPGAAVSRNPLLSCQPPGASNHPNTGAGTQHPGPGAPEWLTCARTRRGEPRSQHHQQESQQTVIKGTGG